MRRCGFRWWQKCRAVCVFRDERGITTVSMAVSMFLSLALIFSAAQLYKIQSAAADIQEVADVASLAAENEVAEFMIAANTCDAIVLSMTLLAGTLYGVGIVTACIPPLSELSANIINAATKTAQARDKFSEKAAEGLNRLQQMLPFLSAAAAAEIGKANNIDGDMYSSYFPLAMLVPAKGEPIGKVSDNLLETGQYVEDLVPDMREKSAEVEHLAQRADEAKRAGYEADCGRNPSACMYERFNSLAGFGAEYNPLYESADTWSFKTALLRAKYYYSERYDNEDYYWDDHDEHASDSVLRMYYYDYAYTEIRQAYFEASDERCTFPKLFRNLEEMRSTSLYTKQLFPVTESDNTETVHAWGACSAADGYTHEVSVREMENANYAECERCHFTIESIANIASATTNVSSGFEYHYQEVRRACDEYNEVMEELEPLKTQVQEESKNLFQGIADVIADTESRRIHALPPGRYGAIAMVVNTASNDASAGFENTFIASGQTFGTRAAVSGATLIGDSSDSASSVITSLLDGVADIDSAAVGVGKVVLDSWSTLLRAFEDGQSALSDGVSRALNSIHTTTISGLGDWAAGELSSVFQAIGLEPVQLDSLKPILVNTGSVAARDTGQFAVRYSQIKQSALSASNSSTDLFSALAAGANAQMDASGIADGEIAIADIEFPVGDVVIPIKITVPQETEQEGATMVANCINSVAGAAASIAGIRSWQ